MRTAHKLPSEKPVVYTCELETCPRCEGPVVTWPYVSGPKTVQTLAGVVHIAQRPKHCADTHCADHQARWKSARWQQIAPPYCTYGYDVLVQIGWQRQTHGESFAAIHHQVARQLQISESQVRYLYHQQYLPLLACHERQHRARLEAVAAQTGLLLSLDGLAPEGGEPQLWIVRELQTQLTLRCGWLSQQDQPAFAHFLQPIADQDWRVAAVLSDKQRGLEPAVAQVFPGVPHGFCHLHYLRNAAAPVAAADEAMKVTLRKAVRQEVGDLVRQEQEEQPGVLTVTGLLPSPLPPAAPPEPPAPAASDPERAAIVQDLLRRVRYLLTLKGRPPFRLAGVEMVERLTEVVTCLDTLLAHAPEPRLARLRQGLQHALQTVQPDYADLRQAADWLAHLADLLDPDGKPARSGAAVRAELFAYLEHLDRQQRDTARLHAMVQTLIQVSRHYEPGLFHCYDLPGLPRTNNERESAFRELNRRLLRTTGQKGLVRRLIQREGAWELLPHPASLPETIQALAQVDAEELRQERQRVRTHRARFRLHTRSPKRAQAQLQQLQERWLALPPASGP